MIILKERFIVDETGQRVGVLLDIEAYRRLLEDVEELSKPSVPMMPRRLQEMKQYP